LARTYHSEGRQLAYFLRAILVFLGVVLYYSVPGLHWIWLIVFLIVGILIAEMMGLIWTHQRRKSAAGRPYGKSAAGRKKARSNAEHRRTDEDLIRADIDTLSGPEFERLLELYYTDKGYIVQRVGGSGDHEVDLILIDKDGYKIAVQCKRWKKDVGNDIVLRIKAGKQIYGCHDAWIITTSHFTKAAKEAAESLRIRLINGLAVHDMISRWRKERIGADSHRRQR